jgi:PKD repeat protein
MTDTGVDNHARIPEFQVMGVPPAPVTNFSGSPTSGDYPLMVNFTDQSTGVISSRSWQFGDGGSSTATNPTHTYQTQGVFHVTLTVTGPGGSTPLTKNGYITVTKPVGYQGDLDGDLDVDQADFGAFQRCYSGPGIAQHDANCAKSKLDGDNDVDLDDFAIFQGCMSGPGVAPPAGCLN